MYSRGLITSLLLLSTSAFADDAQFSSEQEIIATALGSLTISEIQELTNLAGCEGLGGVACSNGTCAEDTQTCTTRVKSGLEGPGNKCLCVLRSHNKCGSTEAHSPQPPSGTKDAPNSCQFGTCEKPNEECGVKEKLDSKGKPIDGQFECACAEKPPPSTTPPAGQQGGQTGGAQGQRPGANPATGGQTGGQQGQQPSGPTQTPGSKPAQQPPSDGGIVNEAAGAADTVRKGTGIIRAARDVIRLLEGLF